MAEHRPDPEGPESGRRKDVKRYGSSANTFWRRGSIRVELWVDQSPDARLYNDQTMSVQFGAAVDPIVRF